VTLSLGLPAQLLRAVDRYLGSVPDRSYAVTQAIGIALQQDADLRRRVTAGATGPITSAVRATAQPPYPNDPLSAVSPGGARFAPPAPSHNTAVFTLAFLATLAGPFSLIRP
jgi:hypothetical protein